MKSRNKIYEFTHKANKINIVRMQVAGYRFVHVEMLYNPRAYQQIAFILKSNYDDYLKLYEKIELIELMDLYTIHLAQNYREPEPERPPKKR